MVRDALELECDSPHGLRVERDFRAPESFDGLAVGEGVAHGGVAGDRFGDHKPPRRRRPEQQGFRPAMLVAELNLEVPHDLAVALEAKMARFDDAGMHGADGDFMDPRSFDTEERMGTDRGSSPLRLCGVEIRVPTQGF